MMVYHGSPNNFKNFDLSKTHGMIWLTSNKEYAQQFGAVKQYELTINNPLDMSGYALESQLERWQDVLSNIGINPLDIDWETADFAPDYGYYYFYDLLPHDGNNYTDNGLLDAIKDAGYDSIITPVEYCDGVCSETTIVIFDTNNIKEVK